ncbi:hypothetical protein G5I_04383 [Acromyrmex echinatior]|uniref:Uncharacterized protein n=1 Tax=Acromyrmex echinatior TaxID=103372 RepID=F4WFH5_ACREC|nr:hypothetical protein G5I_04383 [Acromyrmex echinatior]
MAVFENSLPELKIYILRILYISSMAVNFRTQLTLGLQSCINCKNGTGYIDKEYHPTKADIMFKKKIKMLIANITYNGIAFLVTQDVEIYIKNVKKISDIAVIDYKSFVKSSVGHIYMWGFIFNVPIKKYVPCEFTNAFDIFNSTTALSPMSMAMAYEFINEELHILNDLETAFDDQHHNLLQLADALCEKNLQMDCISKIKKTINISNVMYLFNLINNMNEGHRKESTKRFKAFVVRFLTVALDRIH